MDAFTKKLLAEWNLSNLQDDFERHGISEITMPLLDEKKMIELIPKIGDRMIFELKWKERYGKKECPKSQDMDNKCNETSRELSNTIHEYSSSEDEGTKPYKLVRENAFMGKTSYRRSKELSTVRQILQNNYQGAIILKNYSKTKLLSRKSANVIVDIIISELLKECDRLTNTQFENIAKTVVQIFPTESIKTYYIAPTSKALSHNNKSIPSRGKLVDKYRNKLRQKKILSDVVNIPQNKIFQEESDDEDNEKEVKQSVEWLKNNRAPWKEVLYHWEITFQYRRKGIEKKECGKVHALFEQWPILKQPNGYLLIECDFYALKLTKVINTKEIWDEFFKNVGEVRSYHDRDTNAVSLSNLLVLDDLTDDCRVIIQTWLLAHYVPPKGRIRVQKKHVKFSIPDCKDSMIVHVTRSDDIATTQEKIEKRSAELSTSLQPYMIVVGKTFTTISDFYVCVDRVRYKVDSALSALDILFKIFHVLDAGYPPASEHLWNLMERVVYKFGNDSTKSISYIETIIQQIRNLEAISGSENNVKEVSTEINTDTEVSS